MLRKAPILALLIGFASWYAGSIALAQESNDPPRPTLSDRLEQFRRSIVGAPEQPSKQQSQSRSARPTNNTRRPTALRQPAYGPPPNGRQGRMAQQDDAPRYEPDDAAYTAERQGMTARSASSGMAAAGAGSTPPSSRRTAPSRSEGQYRAYAPAATDAAQRLGPADLAAERDLERAGRAPQAAEPDPSSYRAADRETEPAQTDPRGRESVAQRMARSEGLGARGLIGPPPAKQSAAADNVMFTRTGPILGVETTGPRKISVGKEATYKVLVKNSGEVPAVDVIVSIAVPDFAEVVDTIATAGNTQPAAEGHATDGLHWRLGNLAAHAKEELTLQIVPHKSQSFDLAVRWMQSPQVSAATVEVQEPKLEMALAGAKEVLFGEKQLYKITMSNPGTGDAENVVIHLMPLSPSDKSVASHRIGTIKAGASKTVEVELIARQSGHLSIKAEATASGDLKATLAEEILVRKPALRLAVAGPKVQYAGTPAAYEVRVTNPGDAVARHVTVVCKLPPQSEYISATGAGQLNTARTEVTWTLDSLPAAGEETFVVKCALSVAGANRVEAGAVADGDLKETAAAATQVELVADLVLDIADPTGPIPTGEEMVYDVKVRNRGTKAAEAVEITAYFSKGIEPISVEGGRYEISPGTVVIQAIPSLDAGQEVVYKIKARAEQPGNHRFRAELNCKPLGTKLTQEETTLFYGDEAVGKASK
jgi:uncharacterized repeat protein (TIGR01451 family)